MEKELFDPEIWREVFIGNYDGKTNEAKALQPFLKKTYKNDVYIPWATMERLANLQDPSFNIQASQTRSYGTDARERVVFFNDFELEQERVVGDKRELTRTSRVVPMVHLTGTFLGKTMEEWYPIQDNSYDAPQAIDQNMVNKALQRAKTRLTSRLTGLGLSLYENGELQFDSPESGQTKTIVEKAIEQGVTKVDVKQESSVNVTVGGSLDLRNTESTSLPKSNDTPAAPTNAANDEKLVTYAQELKNDIAGFAPVMQRVNASLVKSVGKPLNLEKDTIDDIVDVLSKIKDADVFMNAVRKQRG